MRKHNLRYFLLLIFALNISNNGFAQLTTPKPGFQLGYYRAKSNVIDAGGNAYWFKKNQYNHLHIFGPTVTITGIFSENSFYVGQRLGFNYHYLMGIAIRVSPAIENNCQKDIRIGTDIGVSFLGLYVYGGYYYPIAGVESDRISKYRVGVRYIFNLCAFERDAWL